MVKIVLSLICVPANGFQFFTNGASFFCMYKFSLPHTNNMYVYQSFNVQFIIYYSRHISQHSYPHIISRTVSSFRTSNRHNYRKFVRRLISYQLLFRRELVINLEAAARLANPEPIYL